MPPRKEPCRNFMRGSCQYGARCKFLHAAQQQPKQNPFGFGSQSNNFQNTNLQLTRSSPFGFDAQNNSQPRAANPFGFGVQSNSQPRGANDSGFKQNQYKPFENKWTRSASTNSPSARQPDNMPAAPSHTCTDSDSCRRQIVEDFNNEKPLWILTCYGHRKNGPCDITGDVSYEELRAAAYDDAKRGQSMISIVERERSLLNSKVAEFENLLRNPNVASTPAPNVQSPFPGATPNAPLNAQSSSPPLASSFSQLGALLNTGPTAPPTNTFGQPSPLGFSGSFGFGSQVTNQSYQNPFTPSNISPSSERNPFSSSTTLPHFPNPSGVQFPTTQEHFPATVAVSPVSINFTNAAPEEFNGDDSIWTKKEWKVGEIPDQPPPDRYIY